MIFIEWHPVKILALDADVIFTSLARFIHPSELTRENFPNVLSTSRFTNLKLLRLESKTVS